MNTKMQSQRSWIACGVAAAVLLAVLSWFFVVRPEFSSTSSLKSQTADAEVANVVLMQKVNSLRKQNNKLGELTDQLAAKSLELPSDSSLQDYTRQLIAQAALSGVKLQSITAGAVALAGPAVGAKSVGNPAGKLFQIPVSVTTLGSLMANRALLKAIQDAGPRRSLLTSVQFTPSQSKVPNIDTFSTMTLQTVVFVAPQTPQAEAALEKQLGHK